MSRWDYWAPWLAAVAILAAVAMLTYLCSRSAAFATTDGPHNVHPIDRSNNQVVDVFHDDARRVTCWVADDHGIFCMSDRDLASER